jgi:hypothetical protein
MLLRKDPIQHGTRRVNRDMSEASQHRENLIWCPSRLTRSVMSKLVIRSLTHRTAGLMALSFALLGDVLAEGPRAQEQSCLSQPAPDLIDDFSVLDTAPPDAHTRVQDESDIDIKFRWFSDLNDLQGDGHYVTYGIRNLAQGRNSGLVFLWEGTGLSRPSTNPLRSLGTLTLSNCFETRPMRRDRLIRYSPSLARDVSTPAYIVPGTAGADKERATWSRVMTDFLDELGQVVDALFEFRSKFTAKKLSISSH